jgi:type IV secretory pathway VirB2 component (pilin)
MQQLLNYTGNLAGGLGVLLCIAAGLTRLTGTFYLAGYEATTIFSVGTGLMVFACLLKLEASQAQQKQE